MLTSHFPFPLRHFATKNLIGPREMGNGVQMRILVTEVSPSVVVARCSFSMSCFGDLGRQLQVA